MSWQATHWALREAPMLRTPKDKPNTTARLVLVALAEAAGQLDAEGKPVPGKEFDAAFPSVFTLTYRTGLCERSVRDALKALEANGLIREAGTVGGGVVNWSLNPSLRRPETDLAELEAAREAHIQAEAERWQERKRSRKLAPEGLPLQEFGSGLLESGSGAPEFGSGLQEPNAPIEVLEKSLSSPGEVQPSGGPPAAPRGEPEDTPDNEPAPAPAFPAAVVESKDGKDEETQPKLVPAGTLRVNPEQRRRALRDDLAAALAARDPHVFGAVLDELCLAVGYRYRGVPPTSDRADEFIRWTKEWFDDNGHGLARLAIVFANPTVRRNTPLSVLNAISAAQEAAA